MNDSKLKAVEIYNQHCELYSDELTPEIEAQIKQHALVTVGHIINATPFKLGFWMDVKEEIKKL